MKRKVLAMTLVGAMVVSMAACGSAESAASSAAEELSSVVESIESTIESVIEEGESSEEGSEEESSTEESTTETTADLSSLKIGMLMNTTHDDGGFDECQYLGVVGAMENLGMSEDQYIYIEGVNEETVATANAVEQLVEEGCNVIMGGSTGYAPILSELASEYPEVQFTQVGVPIDNLITYHLRAYEAMYGVGYLAAMKSDGDKLGYVAGMSEASVRFSINAFALGAQHYNENATVDLLWANSWYDPAAEGECAKTLAASGINSIGTGTTSPGASQACAEVGAYSTGYDLDHTDYAPDSVLVSCIWNWVPLFTDLFQSIAASDAPYVDNYFWGAKEGCAVLSYNDALVSEEEKAEVDGVLQQIADGEIVVFSGPLSDNEGNELLADGEVMDDATILDQMFLVSNVNGTM